MLATYVREQDLAGHIGVAWHPVGKRRSGQRWTADFEVASVSIPGREIVTSILYSGRVSGVKTA
jgi:hypothetical protein